MGAGRPHLSLGVDMVEYEKAGSFYERNADRLGRFFTPSEVSYIRRSSRPSEALALIFAAKEAVFKSLRQSWMGLEGFRLIRVSPSKRGLSFRLDGRFRGAIASPGRMELFVKKSRRYVLVSCQPADAVVAGAPREAA